MIKKSIKTTFIVKTKKIFNIDDIDANKILVFKKEQCGKNNSSKYFIGYNDNGIIRQLYLFISQTTGYFNKFDKNKIIMSNMIKDIQRFKKYNKIWKKIEKIMKIDFNTKATYDDDDDDDDADDDDKYLKTKIKTYKNIITTNFYNKNGSEKIPEENVPHKCLSIKTLDSIIYAYEQYHPQIFYKECKYMKKKDKN